MNTNSHLKINLNKILRPAFIMLLSVFSECTQATPTAAFNANQTSGCAPLNVQFTSSSTGAVSYYWDMGNGNTSTLPNPANLYTTPGSYTISLVVTDASGQTDTAVITNYINAIGQPNADFNCPVTSTCIDDNLISFNNTSIGGLHYLWDFGDGTTSGLNNPVHHYNQSGTFTITLIATNFFGCQDVKIRNLYVTIYPKPVATISANTTSSCDTFTVFNFSSSGSGIVSWNWNFGDGTNSPQQNPSHGYGTSGAYAVSLIVTDNNGCRDTSDVSTNINVGTSHWASFTANPDSGCAPLTVTFNNTNANVASSSWTFGDGNTSTQLSPSHTYNNPGVYTVSLIVTTTNGCTDSIIRSNYITVGIQPVVNFTHSIGTGCAPHAVHFTNTSSGFATCQWNFGDGTISNSTNPTHSYSANGVYSVTLTCWGPTGCNKSKTLTNIISISSAHGLFSANPRIGCPPLNVNFTNASYGNQLTYHWDFGDGATSTLATPSHIYNTSGNFQVTLVAMDSLGCTDTIRKPAYIQTLNPAANYIPPPTTVGCAPVTAQFTDASMGSFGWLWDFGDGNTSTLQNPIHSYLLPGYYTVSLTTQSAGGGCTQSISNFSTFDVKGGYAGFTHTDSPCPPYQSSFTDTSLNAVSWFWDFGDGSTSTQQNPSHVYSSPGYHSAKLSITTIEGCSYTTMQSNSIYFPPFGANFYGIPQGTGFPQAVNFYANSMGATGWIWDFGDSTSSTQENPVHTYTISGNYDVTLTITNGPCTLFYAPPPFNFGNPDSTPISGGNPGIPEVQMGCGPLSVSFSNYVPGSVQWHWDFGDGDTSLQQFGTHTYFTPGIYTVTLTTYDSLGLASVLTMDSIVRVSGPKVHFTFSKAASCTNTLIQLIDSSTGVINKWFWNLGDGTVDTTKNISHTYTGGMPNYIVTHTVTDTMGCSSTISTSIFSNFISPLLVSESEICGLDTVHFNTSLQNYSAYLWDFGDSSTSTLENPSHLYTTEGSFIASVTVNDSSGCSQTFNVFPPITVSLPVVNFNLNGHTHGCGRTRFDFVNLSSNADSYFWDFGDGSTSNNAMPSHIYNYAGRFTVSLTVYRGNCVANLTIPQYVTIDTAYAGFTFTVDGICIPVTQTFRDLSANPVAWLWNFGNGDTSTAQNPVEVYPVRASGNTTLTITDIHGCTATTAHAPVAPLVADFKVLNTSGCSPFTAVFTNNSQLAQEWHWEFGDGDTSSIPSPSHSYLNPGTYNVTLVVTSIGYHCSDTLRMPQLIKAIEPLSAFSTPDLSACAPSVVNFTSFSTDADTYLWDFGDSTTSTNQNPSHIYNTPGIYPVSLISSSNFGCSDTMIKQRYIYVLGSVTDFIPSGYAGCNPYNVNFTDLSLGAIDWSWNFGDGYAVTQQSPSHLYQDTGSFTVSLVTHDTAGCSSYYELPEKIVVYPVPAAFFTTNDTIGCQPYTAHFMNASISGDSIYWDFGDGVLSTDTNPTHTYTTAGAYAVSLITKNQFGCTDTFVMRNPIIVHATPQPDFTVDTDHGCSVLSVQFQNTSANLVQPSYLWDFGNGLTSVLANPSVQFPDPGFYSITLTITNSSGCNKAITYQSFIHVFDTLPPPISQILSVSVSSNTSIIITWENNPAIDLGSYILYRLNNLSNLYEVVNTDTNPNNTGFALNPTYTDTGLNTLQNTYTYKLQSLDICGYTIGLDQLEPHTSINIVSQRSGHNIIVWWNAYAGCAVSNYELYRSHSGVSPQLIATVPANQLTYLDTTFECPCEYSYKVRATDLCGRPYNSNSDTTCTSPFNFLANQIVDVVRSTVVDNQIVLTEWKQPVVHPEKVDRFEIYRSTDNTNFSFQSNVSALQTDFIDNNVDVQNNHYFYKIKVVNKCDINEDPSVNTSTILLKGAMSEDRSVHLNWSPYIGWDTGVDFYIIEKLDGNGQWQLLKQVNGSVINYDYQE